ncbi:MAG: decaprenyl-phosphate phosphoribosyltransferase, partial [Mycobacteriaceae bacterium]
TMSATAVILSYGLWAFTLNQTSHSVWSVISMVPFTVAVLRYAVDVDGGVAGEPEEIALKDRVLQVLALAWVVSIGISVYV